MIARPTFVITAAACLVVAVPAASSANPGNPNSGKPVAGARSLGIRCCRRSATAATT